MNECKHPTSHHGTCHSLDALGQFPIAMAYVPIQHMSHIYENLNEALKIGTLFPELTKPFVGRRNKS